MKNQSIFSFNFQWAFFVALSLGLMLSIGCNKDDEEPTPEAPIASFQFEVSTDNFLEVSFTNFSQNATSYAWDFGDGKTSTEKDPTHVYDAAGVYTVALTASNDAGESAKREETITLTDPDAQLTLLAGAESKTWYLLREGVALGIGPEINDVSWWAFGGAAAPLADRPCILDDAYTFTRDGAFEYSSNGTLYIDEAACCGGWHESAGCWDESDPDVWGDNPSRSAFGNGGDYTFEFDQAANTLTINGEGAFIGLANKTNSGDNPNPESTKFYEIITLAEGDIADTLQLGLPINGGSNANGGGGYWNFYLVSYKNPADLPDIPASEPRANFDFQKNGLTVTFTNTSANATSYSWNFGDGMISTEESPTHTYMAEGAYTVTLTAMDDDGNMDEISKEVVLSSVAFTPAALSSADGKVWRLDGANSYYVGETIGSNGWWAGITEADVETRACQMDDEFIFFDDGTFQYDAKGSVWGEPFMLVDFACVDESELQAPYDVLGSGTYTFEVMEGSDDTNAMITVIGDGAFIGFPKGNNSGELDGTVAPPGQITYEVIDYSSAGGTDVITISVNYTAGWWTMRLISEN
ncbi:MAG: PKD domain-containing protein [Phaeodactylibacter sp.]|nr:PKD domain-containing protein [Phaeodactylibacter sp.]